VVLVELPGHVTAWVVTQHELLRQVLTDPRVAKSSRHWDAWTSGEVPAGWPLEEYISLESMTTADGAEHRRLRSLIVQAFTPRRVAALRPRIERITADLLDDLAARAPGPVDLVAGYSYQLPMRVIGELFGIPTDRLDQPPRHHQEPGQLHVHRRRGRPDEGRTGLVPRGSRRAETPGTR
jgi:2-hydroxy-5-methyl-1-naphthoate 7-hydroxylase